MFNTGFPDHWTTLKKLLFAVGSGIAGGGGFWKTVTGTLIHITDALASPVKELSVAVQNSDGVTGCNINVHGVNFYDGEWEYGNISDDTGQNSGTSTSYFRSKNYLSVPGGVGFYWYSPTRSGTFRQFYYDKDKNFLGYGGERWNRVITPWANNEEMRKKIAYIRFRVSSSYADYSDSKISINYPTTVTEYLPHAGTTYPISWQTEVGSITSGTLKIAEDGSVSLETGGATHQLESITPISTLAGENNIWADVNGEITLTYQAVPETAFSDETDKGMADYMTLTE